jgi:hypothetical protein
MDPLHPPARQEPPAVDTGLSWLRAQFEQSPYTALRGIVCEMSNERLTVRGSVPSFYLKQIAQTLAMKTVAPEQLESRIDVRSR